MITEGPFAKITSMLHVLHHGKSSERHLRPSAAYADPIGLITSSRVNSEQQACFQPQRTCTSRTAVRAVQFRLKQCLEQPET
jgi:hypothetical protein